MGETTGVLEAMMRWFRTGWVSEQKSVLSTL
jgi:hypothetical protein